MKLSKKQTLEQSSEGFYCFDETVKYSYNKVSYFSFFWQEKNHNNFQNGGGQGASLLCTGQFRWGQFPLR